MQVLKGLVMGLGILVVGAMVLVGWGIYYKANNPNFRLFSDGDKTAAAPAVGAPPAVPTNATAPFGEISMGLPADCTIVGMQPYGDRLYLRVGPTGPCERVVVVDTARGTVLGTIAAHR